MKLYSLTLFVAAILFWNEDNSKVETWKLVAGQTMEQCRKVEAEALKYKPAETSCKEIRRTRYEQMVEIAPHIVWHDGTDNPIIGGFDCNGRRCVEFGQ